jgi:NAD(P)H-hydrate repair Nnr-like enzyme with NAD(P)H-hydrate dehydratase domain
LDGLRFPELLEVIKSRRNYHQRRRSETTGRVFSCKAAAKIQAMGPKYVVIKKESGALLFHDQMYFLALPLEKYSIPQTGDTFAGGFAGFITQSENVSFENMKNAIIYSSNLASFCREIWN